MIAVDGGAGIAPLLRIDEAKMRGWHLASGLVLFTYVTTHLLNHALGLVSLAAMEEGLSLASKLWSSWPGTLALYGALMVHVALALRAIYRRRRFSMSAKEWAQLVLGLSIVPLLSLHVSGTRIAGAAFGIDTGYPYVLTQTWLGDPAVNLRQVAGLFAAWAHGCIGLHLVWRLRPWYRRAVAGLYGAAVLLPVLALLGYVSAGREVARLLEDERWRDAFKAGHLPDQAELAAISAIQAAIVLGFAGLVAAAFAARAVRGVLARRKGQIRVTFPDHRTVEIAPGASILDASRQGGIPHAEVCGGRGRCSTCRVRIGSGLDRLPAPSDLERKVLERIAAAPNVRLACQTRPTADVAATPLLPPSATARDGFMRPAHLSGQEHEVAILFADLRAFTQLSEHKLPYDVVFLLNRYFSTMGGAVEQAGGRVDKFIGDGVMALFGVGMQVGEGCRRALAAARYMAEGLDMLNQALAQDLEAPLRIGIGLHVGPAIVGEMGYGTAVGVTAVGDAVNIASRLEGLTKEYRCQLVLSEAVAERAGIDLSAFERHEISVRGRREMLAIRVVPEAKALPAMLAAV